MYTTNKPPAIFYTTYSSSGLGGNFFSDLWETIKTVTIPGIRASAMPWTIDSQDWEDIKNGEGIAAVGSPLHGISAGIAITRAFGNPVQGFENLRDIINDPSFEVLGDQIQSQIDYSNKAWDQGKYPVFFMVGNYVAGVMAPAGTTASEITSIATQAENSANSALLALDAAKAAEIAGNAINVGTTLAPVVVTGTTSVLTAGTIGAGLASGAIIATLPPPVVSQSTIQTQTPVDNTILSTPQSATIPVSQTGTMLDAVNVTAQVPVTTGVGGTIGSAIATGSVIAVATPPAISQTTLEPVNVTAQKPTDPSLASIGPDLSNLLAAITSSPTSPTLQTEGTDASNPNSELNKDLKDPDAGKPTWWENLIKKYGVPYLLKNLPGILQKLFGGKPNANELQQYQDYLNSQNGLNSPPWGLIVFLGLVAGGVVLTGAPPPKHNKVRRREKTV